MTVRICHLSSAHHGLDVRIFAKECVSLVKAGFDVHLVIEADEKDVDQAAALGVTLHRVAPARGRLQRFLFKSWRTFRTALNTRARIYHFHDPELLPFGVLLRMLGNRVIYDAHEDLPRDILSKDWIPTPLRRIVAVTARAVEHACARWFVEVVAATPAIHDGFRGVNSRALVVKNYPILGELAAEVDGDGHRDYVCYIGGISRARGIVELVNALALVRSETRLLLAGNFMDSGIEDEVRVLDGWKRVEYVGWIDRGGIEQVLSSSLIGVVTLHPTPAYIDSLPIKMFEYMAAGLAVVASDFPLWREVVLGNDCGICVDPRDSEAVAAAINFLLANPEEARRLGKNGSDAVRERFNWEAEERKLLGLYEDLAASGSAER